MKKLVSKFIFAAMLSMQSLTSFGQAEIQIIHNSADPGAAAVDIYVNGSLTFDDFDCRVPEGRLLSLDLNCAESDGSFKK